MAFAMQHAAAAGSRCSQSFLFKPTKCDAGSATIMCRSHLIPSVAKAEWNSMEQRCRIRKTSLIAANRRQKLRLSAGGRNGSGSSADEEPSREADEEQLSKKGSTERKAAKDNLGVGSPEIDLALKQAQQQLDFFTQQLQDFADLDPSGSKSNPISNPDELSSLGRGRGFWQPPSFSGGLEPGAEVPPEVFEMLSGANDLEGAEVINPEDRYFEEVSKEELRDILYGPKGDESERREEASSSRKDRRRSVWERGQDETASTSNASSSFNGLPKGQGAKSVQTPPTNGASFDPLPPPSVLQPRIPPPPLPSPNLLPVSPLQRPSSWLSDSYPSAPRLPFTSGRPPPRSSADTAVHQAPPAPQPPKAPVNPLLTKLEGNMPEGGIEAQMPWPPLPPTPSSFSPSSNSTKESTSSFGSAFSPSTNSTKVTTSSFADSPSPFPPHFNSQNGHARSPPQLQSEVLRRIFQMSPEELRQLDRQLATGGAQLDLSMLDNQAPAILAAIRTSPGPADVSNDYNSSEAAADGLQTSRKAQDENVREELSEQAKMVVKGRDKAKTLDSIIDDLSSIIGDGSFAGVEPAEGSSVNALLERLKRLVDISEKAIGELAFGGEVPGEENEAEDDEDSLPWYQEPGECLDHEYYFGNGQPREGMEDLANLFVEEALAEERSSRSHWATGAHTAAGKADVAAEKADVAGEQIEQPSAEADVAGGETDIAEESADVANRQGPVPGTISAEAAAVLRPDSKGGKDAYEVETVSGRSIGNTPLELPTETPEETSRRDTSDSKKDNLSWETRFSNLPHDATIEEKAASLGMFQDEGPESKVSTFEAPRARDSSLEKQDDVSASSAEKAESSNGHASIVSNRGSGGWLGQKVVSLGLEGGLALEDAVKAAVKEHLGPSEKRSKKGAAKGRGLSKAFLENSQAVKKKGRKSGDIKAEEGTKRGASKDESRMGSDETGDVSPDETPTRALGFKRGAGSDKLDANRFLNQILEGTAATREQAASRTESKEAISPNFHDNTIADQKADADESSGTEAKQVEDPSNSQSDVQLRKSLDTEVPSMIPDPNTNGRQSADVVPGELEGSSRAETDVSSVPSSFENERPNWMPRFFDKIHPDSPNFDSEAYAKTHPIRRAMMDDDSEGRFPDFSPEALKAGAPESSKLLEDESEVKTESPREDAVDERLNISEEQRRKVIEAANAESFDPAAYDKTAPPWEAFRGAGTAARETESVEAEGAQSLAAEDQVFEVPTRDGRKKQVKIPTEGFKNEEELEEAFKDVGTYPYMADNFETVADDDVLEEVPAPELSPEDADMRDKVEELAYSMRDFLGMKEADANFFKKGLVDSSVTFEDPLHCFTTSATWEDWFDLFTRNGYAPSLDFIWFEADPAHRWKRWVYITLTVTLPKDLKKQLEEWGAHGWYEAEFGEGPEEVERNSEENSEDLWGEEFRKALGKSGLTPMQKKEKPLVLEMFSKCEMDASGKITSVYSTWENFEEVPSSEKVRTKRRLFMAALLRKAWA